MLAGIPSISEKTVWHCLTTWSGGGFGLRWAAPTQPQESQPGRTGLTSSGTASLHQYAGTIMLYQTRGFTVAITASEARKRLFPLIKQVNDDRAPVEIISNHGRAYLVAADDYESMEETDYLLRSPANATRLMAAAEEVRRGRNLLTKTMEELETMADEDEPL
jgi:antitoxin YefM